MMLCFVECESTREMNQISISISFQMYFVRLIKFFFFLFRSQTVIFRSSLFNCKHSFFIFFATSFAHFPRELRVFMSLFFICALAIASFSASLPHIFHIRYFTHHRRSFLMFALRFASSNKLNFCISSIESPCQLEK